MTTLFTFSAVQWTDPDLPLTYQFGFESVVSLSNLVVVSRSERSYASSTLPSGDISENNRVNCSLRIFDTLGAFSDSASTVTVRSAQEDGGQTTKLLVGLLQSSADNIGSAKSAISVVASVLNSVNCTAAPNCTVLHRSPCRKTSGQCGACIEVMS